VHAGQVSDPFLFAGWARRAAHLVNGGTQSATFLFEVDSASDGTWKTLDRISVPAGGAAWRPFTSAETGEWIRVSGRRG
jgi:hypothetical protein